MNTLADNEQSLTKVIEHTLIEPSTEPVDIEKLTDDLPIHTSESTTEEDPAEELTELQKSLPKQNQ